jgi:hypothetical protein
VLHRDTKVQMHQCNHPIALRHKESNPSPAELSTHFTRLKAQELPSKDDLSRGC